MAGKKEIPYAGEIKNNDKALRGFQIPKNLVATICPVLGKKFHGKAQPLSSDQTSGNALHQPIIENTVWMYGDDDAPFIFPRVLTIPSFNGMIKWPVLDQNFPGPEGSAAEFAQYGLAGCGWVAEGADSIDSEPNFKQKTINSYPLVAVTRMTRHLAKISAVDIESLLRTIFKRSMYTKIDRAIINGDGNNKPLGILQTPGLPIVARAVGGDIAEDDLTNLEHSVSELIRSQCIFIIADDAVKLLKTKKDSTGRPLYPELSGVMPRLRNYPVVMTKITSLGTAGDVIFGFPGAYVCGLEEEMLLNVDDYTKMSSSVRIFYAFMSIGGQVANPLSFAKLV